MQRNNDYEKINTNHSNFPHQTPVHSYSNINSLGQQGNFFGCQALPNPWNQPLAQYHHSTPTRQHNAAPSATSPVNSSLYVTTGEESVDVFVTPVSRFVPLSDIASSITDNTHLTNKTTEEKESDISVDLDCHSSDLLNDIPSPIDSKKTDRLSELILSHNEDHRLAVSRAAALCTHPLEKHVLNTQSGQLRVLDEINGSFFKNDRMPNHDVPATLATTAVNESSLINSSLFGHPSSLSRSCLPRTNEDFHSSMDVVAICQQQQGSEETQSSVTVFDEDVSMRYDESFFDTLEPKMVDRGFPEPSVESDKTEYMPPQTHNPNDTERYMYGESKHYNDNITMNKIRYSDLPNRFEKFNTPPSYFVNAVAADDDVSSFTVDVNDDNNDPVISNPKDSEHLLLTEMVDSASKIEKSQCYNVPVKVQVSRTDSVCNIVSADSVSALNKEIVSDQLYSPAEQSTSVSDYPTQTKQQVYTSYHEGKRLLDCDNQFTPPHTSKRCYDTESTSFQQLPVKVVINSLNEEHRLKYSSVYSDSDDISKEGYNISNNLSIIDDNSLECNKDLTSNDDSADQYEYDSSQQLLQETLCISVIDEERSQIDSFSNESAKRSVEFDTKSQTAFSKPDDQSGHGEQHSFNMKSLLDDNDIKDAVDICPDDCDNISTSTTNSYDLDKFKESSELLATVNVHDKEESVKDNISNLRESSTASSVSTNDVAILPDHIKDSAVSSDLIRNVATPFNPVSNLVTTSTTLLDEDHHQNQEIINQHKINEKLPAFDASLELVESTSTKGQQIENQSSIIPSTINDTCIANSSMRIASFALIDEQSVVNDADVDDQAFAASTFATSSENKTTVDNIVVDKTASINDSKQEEQHRKASSENNCRDPASSIQQEELCNQHNPAIEPSNIESSLEMRTRTRNNRTLTQSAATTISVSKQKKSTRIAAIKQRQESITDSKDSSRHIQIESSNTVKENISKRRTNKLLTKSVSNRKAPPRKDTSSIIPLKMNLRQNSKKIATPIKSQNIIKTAKRTANAVTDAKPPPYRKGAANTAKKHDTPSRRGRPKQASTKSKKNPTVAKKAKTNSSKKAIQSTPRRVSQRLLRSSKKSP